MSKLSVVGKAHEARSAEQDFAWFVYGSSLDRDAFAAWAEQHGYVVPDFSRAVPSRLPEHRLAFDVMSRFWGGATASVTPAPGAHVEGILLPLPPEARGLVDHKEGGISGLYEPFEADVLPLAGGAPRKALVYRSSPSRRMPAEGAPAPRFLETLVKGARDFGLSPAWIETLRSLG